MAASFEIAARNNGFPAADTRAATLASVTAYREAMAEFAQMPTMDIWYAYLDEDELMASIRTAVAGTVKQAKGARKLGKADKQEKAAKQEAKLAKTAQKRAVKSAEKAHTRDSLQALSKLSELVNGSYRIVSQPPVVVPFRDWTATYGLPAGDVDKVIREQFRAYRATLQDDRRKLLERFEVVDAARKVVGVGSVGTRAFIVLLQGRDAHDPLFLQVKEATASVLEPYVGKSRYRQHGERVVQGQRMMQAASDIYLGWTKGVDVRRHFYWRQLRDMKGSALVEQMRPLGLTFYAGICGWTLARAHARSGDPVAIAAYLGDSDAFDNRSPTSRSGTPTRTSRTTRSSSTRSDPGGWKRSRASENAQGADAIRHQRRSMRPARAGVRHGGMAEVHPAGRTPAPEGQCQRASCASARGPARGRPQSRRCRRPGTTSWAPRRPWTGRPDFRISSGRALG